MRTEMRVISRIWNNGFDNNFLGKCSVNDRYTVVC